MFPFNYSTSKTTTPLQTTLMCGALPLLLQQKDTNTISVSLMTSKFTWNKPVSQKSDFFYVFLQYYCSIENLCQYKVHILRSDGDGEYQIQNMSSFLQSHVIQHQLSCSYTPEQNGKAERKHQHILALVALYYFTEMFHMFFGLKPSILLIVSSTYYSLVLLYKSAQDVLFHQSPKCSSKLSGVSVIHG